MRSAKGRTKILVTHRLSAIKTVDRILVMQDGNMEDGTHVALMGNKWCLCTDASYSGGELFETE